MGRSACHIYFIGRGLFIGRPVLFCLLQFVFVLYCLPLASCNSARYMNWTGMYRDLCVYWHDQACCKNKLLDKDVNNQNRAIGRLTFLPYIMCIPTESIFFTKNLSKPLFPFPLVGQIKLINHNSMHNLNTSSCIQKYIFHHSYFIHF